ncbi:MAG TPA: pyridoxal phosphate-dependent aminotransferase [Gaiellaceae bacterium]|nr:pyridoxal phosphate-dependent aminotransferase [Gaiellaceae bacterium]
MTRFPTYVFEERIRSLGAEPVPLHGTPAPALPPHVVEAVAEALGLPMRTPPARGLESLRDALADELERTTGRAVDPGSQLLVTHGAMQALGVLFRTLLSAGDEVAVPAPCFFFERPIRAGGGRPVYASSRAEEGWTWDVEAIEAAVGPRTRVLLLCNPENPTGHVPSAEEVASAIAVAERHDLLVVTDEAYERSLWDGASLTSAFGLTERAIVVRSLGKSLAMPHLRLGLLAGPADLVEQCAETLEWDCLRVGVASQTAALAALEGPQEWLELVDAAMSQARTVALETVEQIGALEVIPPRGGPFLFLGAPDGRPELADELLAVGLPVVDGGEFQAPGRARLPFGGANACRPALERALAAWEATRA